MVNSPVRAKERVRRAWTLASSVTRATTLLPTKNVTVLVGVPAPAGPRAVAVHVTACPTTAGLTDADGAGSRRPAGRRGGRATRPAASPRLIPDQVVGDGPAVRGTRRAAGRRGTGCRTGSAARPVRC